ncbi:MAG: HEAT repeat domain-containing protein [Myxococcota bacterium]
MKRIAALLVAPAGARKGLLGFAVLLVMAAPALARPDAAAHLEDFVHYARIAKVELALAHGQALLESGITNAELAGLLDDDRKLVERFEDAISRARFVPELEDLAGEIEVRVERGRLDLARDPARIEEAISMLNGTQRAQVLARRRLEEAGEYAIPDMLRQITEGPDERLKLACESMIRQIGRQAVTPLCAALGGLDPVSRRIVCDVLGEIGWPHAAPFLREVSLDQTAPGAVREAAARALRRIGGVESDLATLYADLGRQYFDQVGSLIAFPQEATNNVWSYDMHSGLESQPVPTAIYSEVMAMGMASKALRIDSTNAAALSLFVASNLKRENDLAGASDPIYGKNPYTPEFYATVFGSHVCQEVLGMAIEVLDTPLVRDAIAALSHTTGGANLFLTGPGRQPLLEALQYPDRRVRYEAALTLGAARPGQGFPGDYTVVPLLAAAVRTGNQEFGLVVAWDEEDRRVWANQLESLGFTVIGSGGTVEALGPEIAVAVGVDLLVVKKGDFESARQTVAELRARPKTSATPILILAAHDEFANLKRDFSADAWVHVARANVDRKAFAAAVDELMQRASGGRMTEAEAEAYAIEALATLRDIAISGSVAYDIDDAAPALLDALDTRSGGTRLLVARTLALINDDRAQRKLFSAALRASGPEQIELLDRVAESVKRFGDRTEGRHVSGLLDLVANAGGELAEAAARVHGALNLPTEAAIDLIP